MKKSILSVLTILFASMLLTACGTNSQSTPVAAEVTATTDSTDIPVGQITIYTPMSTSSIPVIIASEQLENVNLVLYADQSQANTEFIRGDAAILVSGLSVGVDMHRNEVPVQCVNSFVSGLSYLVTYGNPVSNLSGLKGKSVYVPFEGSPIDEVMGFLINANGLTYKTDVTPVYSPFESSIELLKQGKAEAVVLPEPSVTLVEDQPNIFISLSLADEWNQATGNPNGYPQVGSFVNPDWAAENSMFIDQFNQALADAIVSIQNDPQAAVELVKDRYKLTPEKLSKSLSRTSYTLVTGDDLKLSIENYYETIGKPLDENFSDFYFGAAH